MKLHKPLRRMDVLAGLVLLLALGCSKSSPSVLVLVPTSMSPKGKATMSPDGAVTFWGKGTLESKVYLKQGPVTITVRCRGNTVNGEAPQVVVDLGSSKVGTLSITSAESKIYTLTTTVPHSGTTQLQLKFANGAEGPDLTQTRALRVDMVTLSQVTS